MPPIIDISPEVLKERHRLSPQQINSLFGRMVIEESFEEKAAALGKVAEFIRVTDAFGAAGISFIPLKGPVLSYRLYGDTTFRNFSDLDILVDSSSIGRVKNILEASGYEAYGQPWPGDTRMQRNLLKYSHHISFLHPDSQIVFEIHWRLSTRQWLNFRQTDRLTEQHLATISCANRSFTALNDELELLYLVIHGGHHHWGMLKWLVDVNHYLNTQKINWERFNALSDSLEANRLVALCNTILAEYFPGGQTLPCSATLPRHMIRYSKKRIAGEVYTSPDSIRTILQSLRFSLAVYPGFRYKCQLLNNVIGNSLLFGRISKLGEPKVGS